MLSRPTFIYTLLQRFVMMDSYDWLVEARSMKDVWRSATMKNGELSVTMDLIILMQQSSVDKWDIPKWVCMSISTFKGTY